MSSRKKTTKTPKASSPIGEEINITYKEYRNTAVGRALETVISEFKDRVDDALGNVLREELLRCITEVLSQNAVKEVKLTGEVEFYNNLSSEWKTTVRDVNGLDTGTLPRLRIYAKEADKARSKKQ